jgi:hypothetical protein
MNDVNLINLGHEIKDLRVKIILMMSINLKSLF